MTEEEINVAICDALDRQYHAPTEEEVARGSYYQYQPNYFRSLDAMHEAEKVLTEKHELFYLIRLTEVMKQDATIGWRIERTYHATASQRAEAFLRCLGKWPD